MERSDNVEAAGVSRNSQPLHGIEASDSKSLGFAFCHSLPVHIVWECVIHSPLTTVFRALKLEQSNGRQLSTIRKSQVGPRTGQLREYASLRGTSPETSQVGEGKVTRGWEDR